MYGKVTGKLMVAEPAWLMMAVQGTLLVADQGRIMMAKAKQATKVNCGQGRASMRVDGY